MINASDRKRKETRMSTRWKGTMGEGEMHEEKRGEKKRGHEEEAAEKRRGEGKGTVYENIKEETREKTIVSDEGIMMEAGERKK